VMWLSAPRLFDRMRENGVYTPAGIIAKPAGTLQGFDKD
jgi:hypothetical protein